MLPLMDACAAHLRADAARNRAALVSAARSVFGEKGLDAPLDEIARRAGVGNATLYRRFPARSDLLAAVFVEHMAGQVAAAEKALQATDPWEGFSTFLIHSLQVQATDRGLADLMTSYFDDTGEIGRLRALAYDRVVELIARAKDAGVLRADFTPQDLALILTANAGVVHRTYSRAPDSWKRVAAFIVDGLRADAATPAPPPPREARVVAALRATASSC
jgi:AcrR family transcriptional regulator